MGSGADNVSRAHMPESMIMGQDGCSIASRASFHCKPLQLTMAQPSSLTSGIETKGVVGPGEERKEENGVAKTVKLRYHGISHAIWLLDEVSGGNGTATRPVKPNWKNQNAEPYRDFLPESAGGKPTLKAFPGAIQGRPSCFFHCGVGETLASMGKLQRRLLPVWLITYQSPLAPPALLSMSPARSAGAPGHSQPVTSA